MARTWRYVFTLTLVDWGLRPQDVLPLDIAAEYLGFILLGCIQVFYHAKWASMSPEKKSGTRLSSIGGKFLVEQRLPGLCTSPLLSPPALTCEALSNERMISSIPSSMDMHAWPQWPDLNNLIGRSAIQTINSNSTWEIIWDVHSLEVQG